MYTGCAAPRVRIGAAAGLSSFSAGFEVSGGCGLWQVPETGLGTYTSVSRVGFTARDRSHTSPYSVWDVWARTPAGKPASSTFETPDASERSHGGFLSIRVVARHHA
eukprot:1399608-Prymnesium_polylepis.1